MYTSGSTGEPKAQFDINNLYHVIPWKVDKREYLAF
jgi:acyl-coenzyme A synthetase/AMP-(fatty) acid ligase